MDTYESKMADLEAKSKTDRESFINDMRSDCICGDCPSYTDCAREKDELLYCLLKRSPECITDEIDCICPSCQVVTAMGLSTVYYCTRGNETEQRAAR